MRSKKLYIVLMAALIAAFSFSLPVFASDSESIDRYLDIDVIEDRRSQDLILRSSSSDSYQDLVIIRDLHDVGVPELGYRATLTFLVQGDDVTYQWWYKNPQDSDFRTYNQVSSNTTSWAITSIRDGRLMYCIATDSHGNTVRSKTAKMYVLPGGSSTKQGVFLVIDFFKNAVVDFWTVYKNTGGIFFTITIAIVIVYPILRRIIRAIRQGR